MMTETRWWQWLLASALAGAGLLLALVIGYIVPQAPLFAVGTSLGVLVLAASVVQPALLPVLAMPLLVVVTRTGGGGVDLTVSDLALGLAFWPAVLLSPRPFSRELRQLLWLNAIYQAATLLAVVASFYQANAVEWVHAWLLVSGSLIVGWAVGRAGLAKVGLTLFLLACIGLALPAAAEGALRWATGDFSPLYPTIPWSMHKNFIGTLLCFAAILAYARPDWMGWSRRWAMAAFWLFAAVIAFSQSRQSILALLIALLIISLRSGGGRRRSTMVLIGVVPAGFAVVTLIRDEVAEGNVHSSVFQRLDWFNDTVALWQESPLFGHGLRYWTTDRTELHFQPPNVFLEMLASAGIVGLTAFIIMAGGALLLLWRLNPTYGTVAFALVLARLVQSQVDLFWVSISVSVPFALAGVALGALAQQHPQNSRPLPQQPLSLGATT